MGVGIESIAFIGGSLNGEVKLMDKAVTTYRLPTTLGTVDAWNLAPSWKVAPTSKTTYEYYNKESIAVCGQNTDTPHYSSVMVHESVPSELAYRLFLNCLIEFPNLRTVDRYIPF